MKTIITTRTGNIIVNFNNSKVKVDDNSNSVLFKDVWYEGFIGSSDTNRLISSSMSTLFKKSGLPIAVEMIIGNDSNVISSDTMCSHVIIILNMKPYLENREVLLSIIDDDVEEVFIEDVDVIEFDK